MFLFVWELITQRLSRRKLPALELDNLFTEDDLAILIAKDTSLSASNVRTMPIEEAAKIVEVDVRRLLLGHQSTTMPDSSEAHEELSSFWVRVQYELHLLLCTKDKKYADVRSQLAQQSGASTIAIISAISAAVGAVLGTGGAAIVPLICLSLLALLRVGKEAYCSGSRKRFKHTKAA